MYQKI